MVSFGDVAMEDFLEMVKSEASTLKDRVEAENAPIEDKLPNIWGEDLGVRQRSLFVHPGEARRELKDLMDKDERKSRFLDVVSAVRGDKVEIEKVSRDYWKEDRAFLLKTRDTQTGEAPMDLRVLIGKPERKGEDIRNEVSHIPFYKLLGLRVYNERANIK